MISDTYTAGLLQYHTHKNGFHLLTSDYKLNKYLSDILYTAMVLPRATGWTGWPLEVPSRPISLCVYTNPINLILKQLAKITAVGMRQDRLKESLCLSYFRPYRKDLQCRVAILVKQKSFINRTLNASVCKSGMKNCFNLNSMWH